MTDYISREMVKDFFLNMDAGSSRLGSTLLTPEEYSEYLDEIPAADVEPVVHGYWIPIDDGVSAKCGICGACACDLDEGFEEFAKSYRYCPRCGAKMDGEVDNNAL